MDAFVENSLKEWGLYERLADVFNQNEIDEETFQSLTEKDVAELIPVLGLRKKFLSKFLPASNILKAAEEPLLISSDTSESTSTSTTNTISNTESSLVDLEEVDNADVALIAVPCYSKKATVGLPQFISTYQNSVRTLLDNTVDGNLIKASYGPGKKFLRSKLCELLIKEEISKSADKKISSFRFKQLASEINDVFFHEEPEIYFVPYVSKANGQPKAARGKLWSTYCYMRKNLKKLGLLSMCKSPEISTVPHSQIDSDVEEKLQWLRNNCMPFITVENYWKSTTGIRLKNFPESIDKYFRTYKCLCQPTGYLLLEADFVNLYEGKENYLLTKWPVIHKLILEVANQRQEKYLMTVLEEYSKSDVKTDTTDEFFALTVLPLLFNSVLKCKNSGAHWRPSKVEIQKGFLLNLKDISHLESELKFREEKYAKYKLTAQPVPVVISQDWNKVDSCYICINNVIYRVDTPLKAVDLCFKVYHVLNAQYPPEVDAVWTFIQKYIYEITTKHDNKYVSVGTLISDLKNLTQNSSTSDKNKD